MPQIDKGRRPGPAGGQYPESDQLAGAPDFPTIAVRIDADDDSLLFRAGNTCLHTSISPHDAAAEVVIKGTSDEVFRTLSGQNSALPKAEVSGARDATRRLDQVIAHAYTADDPPPI